MNLNILKEQRKVTQAKWILQSKVYGSYRDWIHHLDAISTILQSTELTLKPEE